MISFLAPLSGLLPLYCRNIQDNFFPCSVPETLFFIYTCPLNQILIPSKSSDYAPVADFSQA